MTEANAILPKYKLSVNYRGLLEGAEQLFQPDFELFISWIYQQRYIQLDVETNVVQYVRERKLITVQFGSVGQKHNQQWAFQWSYLTDDQKAFIKMVLESERWEKLIQNAMFELTTFLNYNIRIRSIYDTMLVERIIWCGYDGAWQVSSSLEDIALRRLNYQMSKDEQTNFGDNIITSSKVEYMARDVQFLDLIRTQQLLELHELDLEYVAALENEAVIGFAQMTWEGMILDKEEWMQNIEWAMPLIEEAEQKLDQWLHQEPFFSKAVKLGYINIEDQLLINWRSPQQKLRVAQYLFPGITGGGEKAMNTWFVTAIKNNVDHDLQTIAYEFIYGDKKIVQDYLIINHRDWLIENEFLRPAGTSIVNWNSVDQVLPLLKVVNPYIQNMNADSMGKFSHPIGIDIEEYKNRLKLINAYGESFLEHVSPNGTVHTNFSQILTTGRVSSSNPNMQQLPAKELTGQRYRNCFKPPAGFKFVSSDYVSQELAVIAYLTGDKKWQEAIRKGQDLHSICSELVFANRSNPYRASWKEVAENDCAYYKKVVDKDGVYGPAKQKCKCLKHKIMRDACKNINFGLA